MPARCFKKLGRGVKTGSHDECESSSDISTVCGAHEKPANPEVEVTARAQELGGERGASLSSLLLV